MKFQALHRLFAALIIGLFSLPAIAKYKQDASATASIDEAINNHYLMMALDKAEAQLNSTITKCGDNCSPAVKARAWMYIGIVRGSGKSDQAGAAEAFSNAKGLDSGVQLDADLASEETKATFQSAQGSAPEEEAEPEQTFEEPAPMAATGAPGALPPDTGVPGDMICSPQGAAITTDVPVPISCSSDASVSEGFVKFKEPGASDWKKITLEDNAGLWQAEIPCEYTKKAGQLQFYVGVKDSSGEYVDQFGSKKVPAKLTISTSGAAPAFPGQPPVEKCAANAMSSSDSDCPPDFPGCGDASSENMCGDLDWGDSCKNSSQCQCGLLCEEGACATSPSCVTDDECSTGTCVDGYCSVLSNKGGGASSGEFKKHWLNFTAGMDLVNFGGENLCVAQAAVDLGVSCYDANGDPNRRENVGLARGFAAGQVRVKLGYDFALMDHFTIGARLGVAFLNTRPAGQGGFLPVHAAARATYSILPLSQDGFRPKVYLEGGLAEANGKVVNVDIEIYKVVGRQYVAPGFTLGYMFTPQMGINADVQLMMIIPGSIPMTLALHPALSFVYGL